MALGYFTDVWVLGRNVSTWDGVMSACNVEDATVVSGSEFVIDCVVAVLLAAYSVVWGV